MKIRMTVEVDVSFDLESNGVVHDLSVIDSDVVGQALVSVMHVDVVTDSMIEAISENTGWCVSGFSLRVPDVECIDYLD
jgi:hypothetical protein